MKPQFANLAEPNVIPLDRELIRVEVPLSHAGITAALRRAFEAAAVDPRARDFDELLRRLN